MLVSGKLRISTKINFLVLAVLAISFIFAIMYQSSRLQDTHITEEINRSKALTTFCEEIRVFISKFHKLKMFHDQELIQSFKKDIEAGKDYSETQLYLTIPVVSAWTAAEQRADELGYVFRVPKNSPRNPKNLPYQGLEQAVVNFLEGIGKIEDIERAGGKIIYPQDKAQAAILGEISVLHIGSESGAVHNADAIHFFRAIKLTQDCLVCHGDPKGEKDAMGFEKEGWKTGEVHGAFEIIAPLNDMHEAVTDAQHHNMLIAALFFLIASGILFYYLRRVVAYPIHQVVEFVKKLGEGDFSTTLHIQTQDEIGLMTAHLNTSVNSLREIMEKLADTTVVLYDSSYELSDISAEMTSSAERMNQQSDIASHAAKQVSDNVSGVASAAEQSSSSVSNIAVMTEQMSSTFSNMVNFAQRTSENVKNMARSSDDISHGIHSTASAVEEMTVSLNEVAKHTNQASRVSQHANQRTEEINAKMDTLVDASKQIGKVVSMIKKIADQTNMLALNATIEAAGAGQAGKGFAVVAAEVKELAKQSADATDEIAEQIEQIQKSTDKAVEAIEEINKIINEIAAINQSIAASAEEQTATANEISKTIAGNAASIRNVAENANESANLVEEIAKGIDEASKMAKEVAIHVDGLSKGVKDVARSSYGAAKGVMDISQNVESVNISSSETVACAARINAFSKKLSQAAATLLEIVDQFKIKG